MLVNKLCSKYQNMFTNDLKIQAQFTKNQRLMNVKAYLYGFTEKEFLLIYMI